MSNNESFDEGISLQLETPSLYIVSSICQPLPERSETKPDSKTHDLWMTIQVDELGKAFRDLAKQSGRLSRLAQRKKRVCIPSEGFNQLLAQRFEKVECSFRLYMRLKEELLGYIKATARRNDFF